MSTQRANSLFFVSTLFNTGLYLRSHLPQELKHILDVTCAFLPAADDFFPPHLGSDVAVDSWREFDCMLLGLFLGWEGLMMKRCHYEKIFFKSVCDCFSTAGWDFSHKAVPVLHMYEGKKAKDQKVQLCPEGAPKPTHTERSSMEL